MSGILSFPTVSFPSSQAVAAPALHLRQALPDLTQDEKAYSELQTILHPLPLDLEIPEDLCCPITTSLMRDPVATSDGQSYEREAIEAWLENNDTSPLTGAPLEDKKLTPIVLVRNSVNRFVSKHPALKDSKEWYLPKAWVHELAEACQAGNREAIQNLATRDPRLLAHTFSEGAYQGKTALELAATGPLVSLETVIRLLEIRASGLGLAALLQVNARRTLPFYLPPQQQDLKTLLLLIIGLGENIQHIEKASLIQSIQEARDAEGNSLLHIAATLGNAPLMGVLLAHTANPHANNNRQQTPLHLAAYHNWVEVIRLLLAQQASLTAVDDTGNTALHTAAAAGSSEAVVFLLEAGIFPDTQNKDGLTARQLAETHQHATTLQRLDATLASFKSQEEHLLQQQGALLKQQQQEEKVSVLEESKEWQELRHEAQFIETCFKECLDKLSLAKEGDLVLFLGMTGSGKTTTMNYLAGTTAFRQGETSAMGFSLPDPVHPECLVGEAGRSANSITLYPNFIRQGNAIFCDMAGFSDLGGDPKERRPDKILLSSRALMHLAQFVKAVVLVIDAPSLSVDNARAINFANLSHFARPLVDLITQGFFKRESVFCLVTKTRNLYSSYVMKQIELAKKDPATMSAKDRIAQEYAIDGLIDANVIYRDDASGHIQLYEDPRKAEVVKSLHQLLGDYEKPFRSYLDKVDAGLAAFERAVTGRVSSDKERDSNEEDASAADNAADNIESQLRFTKLMLELDKQDQLMVCDVFTEDTRKYFSEKLKELSLVGSVSLASIQALRGKRQHFFTDPPELVNTFEKKFVLEVARSFLSIRKKIHHKSGEISENRRLQSVVLEESVLKRQVMDEEHSRIDQLNQEISLASEKIGVKDKEIAENEGLQSTTSRDLALKKQASEKLIFDMAQLDQQATATSQEVDTKKQAMDRLMLSKSSYAGRLEQVSAHLQEMSKKREAIDALIYAESSRVAQLDQKITVLQREIESLDKLLEASKERGGQLVPKMEGIRRDLEEKSQRLRAINSEEIVVHEKHIIREKRDSRFGWTSVAIPLKSQGMPFTGLIKLAGESTLESVKVDIASSIEVARAASEMNVVAFGSVAGGVAAAGVAGAVAGGIGVIAGVGAAAGLAAFAVPILGVGLVGAGAGALVVGVGKAIFGESADTKAKRSESIREEILKVLPVDSESLQEIDVIKEEIVGKAGFTGSFSKSSEYNTEKGQLKITYGTGCGEEANAVLCVLRQKRVIHTQEIQDLSSDIEKLRKELEPLQKEEEGYRAKKTQLEREMQDFSQSRSEALEKIDRLKETLEPLAKEASEYQTKKTQLEREMQGFSSDIERSRKELEVLLSKEYSEFKLNLQKEIWDASSRIEKLEEELKALKEKKLEYETKKMELESSIPSMQDDRDRVQIEMYKNASILTEMERKLQEHDHNLKCLLEEMHSLTSYYQKNQFIFRQLINLLEIGFCIPDSYVQSSFEKEVKRPGNTGDVLSIEEIIEGLNQASLECALRESAEDQKQDAFLYRGDGGKVLTGSYQAVNEAISAAESRPLTPPSLHGSPAEGAKGEESTTAPVQKVELLGSSSEKLAPIRSSLGKPLRTGPTKPSPAKAAAAGLMPQPKQAGAKKDFLGGLFGLADLFGADEQEQVVQESKQVQKQRAGLVASSSEKPTPIFRSHSFREKPLPSEAVKPIHPAQTGGGASQARAMFKTMEKETPEKSIAMPRRVSVASPKPSQPQDTGGRVSAEKPAALFRSRSFREKPLPSEAVKPAPVIVAPPREFAAKRAMFENMSKETPERRVSVASPKPPVQEGFK